MDSMIYNKMLHTPICTGKPWEAARNRPAEGTEESSAFKELLDQKLKEESPGNNPGAFFLLGYLL